MANVRLLGTPYIRGKAMQVGKKIVRYRTDAPLTIGDTVPGNEIPWIEVDGLLIAQKNVLQGVFRQMLANSGLIQGSQVTIDGSIYRCRLLSIDDKDGEPCEWDMIREVVPDAPWQFGGSIWAQEGLCLFPSGVIYCIPEDSGYGWWPVLEPCSVLSADLIGKRVEAIYDKGSLRGVLVELTDYDLVFQDAFATNLPLSSGQASWGPGGVAVLKRGIVDRIVEL